MRIARVLGVFLAVASPALALSNRVFVSSAGIDVGTCTISSPCRSFSYAMTQVAATGEVIAIDTAGYGTFTINQAVSVIAAPGVAAFIAVTSGTGISVHATSGAVILRGLVLSGSGATIGIDFSFATSLGVERCAVNGFSTAGIVTVRANTAAQPRLRIEECTIRNNNDGILTETDGVSSSTIAPVTISNSTVSDNGYGFLAADNTRASVTDTTFSGNAVGVASRSSADFSVAEVTLERCTITQNTFAGIQAGGLGATRIRGYIRIADNLITGNSTGVIESADGVIYSMNTGADKTNTIEGNATNGSFSGSYTAK